LYDSEAAFSVGGDTGFGMVDAEEAQEHKVLAGFTPTTCNERGRMLKPHPVVRGERSYVRALDHRLPFEAVVLPRPLQKAVNQQEAQCGAAAPQMAIGQRVGDP
jgi:hypothetical protein